LETERSTDTMLPGHSSGKGAAAQLRPPLSSETYVISFRKPSAESLRRIVAAQSRLEFTYPSVGATKAGGPAPAGYIVDHTSVELGRGSTTFDSARAALARWDQFRLSWLEVFPDDTPLLADETVIVLARAFGVWWTNAARIVYTIEELEESPARFGFAYGTLPGHVESGEERFLIEWDRKTDQVWFDIMAFSRPRHFLTRIGRRQARAMQKKFGQQSAAAMRAVVRN
jgi:uncharacterized protein (UPF0548 family)